MDTPSNKSAASFTSLPQAKSHLTTPITTPLSKKSQTDFTSLTTNYGNNFGVENNYGFLGVRRSGPGRQRQVQLPVSVVKVPANQNQTVSQIDALKNYLKPQKAQSCTTSSTASSSVIRRRHKPEGQAKSKPAGKKVPKPAGSGSTKISEDQKTEIYQSFMMKNLLSGKPIMPDFHSHQKILNEFSCGKKTAKQTQTKNIAKTLPIPNFYTHRPNTNEAIAYKMREDARSSILMEKSKGFLENIDLDKLHYLLMVNRTEVDEKEKEKENGNQNENQNENQKDQDKEFYINFKNFSKVYEILKNPSAAIKDSEIKFQKFFTATNFLKLYENDIYGRIRISQFLTYIYKHDWYLRTRVALAMYDSNGEGYFTASNLKNFIHELIGSLPALSRHMYAPDLQSFTPFYVLTAAKKFFFFLDPFKTGKIKIQDILASTFLYEIYQLKDENLSDWDAKFNWFSYQSSVKHYGAFLNLQKKDRSESTSSCRLLSKEEFTGYKNGRLTKEFIDRIFAEKFTFNGNEMDYNTYLEVVLALENLDKKISQKWVFNILDVNHNGKLYVDELKYYLKPILKVYHERSAASSLEANFNSAAQLEHFELQRSVDIIDRMRQGQYYVPPGYPSRPSAIPFLTQNSNPHTIQLEDVLDEIFDMVNPKDPTFITFDDLVVSNMGEIVLRILIDYNAFWSYEHREELK